MTNAFPARNRCANRPKTTSPRLARHMQRMVGFEGRLASTAALDRVLLRGASCHYVVAASRCISSMISP